MYANHRTRNWQDLSQSPFLCQPQYPQTQPQTATLPACGLSKLSCAVYTGSVETSAPVLPVTPLDDAYLPPLNVNSYFLQTHHNHTVHLLSGLHKSSLLSYTLLWTNDSAEGLVGEFSLAFVCSLAVSRGISLTHGKHVINLNLKKYIAAGSAQEDTEEWHCVSSPSLQAQW